jgi:hypothetical protein
MRSRTAQARPADREWHSMLARLEIEDRERRLKAAEAALNRLSS